MGVHPIWPNLLDITAATNEVEALNTLGTNNGALLIFINISIIVYCRLLGVLNRKLNRKYATAHVQVMHKHFFKKSAIWKIISKKNFTKADKTRSETLLENTGTQWEDQCKTAHSSHNPGSIQYSTSGSRSARFITPSLFLAWMCQPPLTSPLVVLVYLDFSVYFCSLPGYIASGRSN